MQLISQVLVFSYNNEHFPPSAGFGRCKAERLAEGNDGGRGND